VELLLLLLQLLLLQGFSGLLRLGKWSATAGSAHAWGCIR
jgi:hypothetical protein